MKDNPFRALPKSVEVDGEEYLIDTDFRMGVAIEIDSLSENPDVIGLLEAFYLGNIPNDPRKAVDCMLRFYSSHNEETHKQKEKGAEKARWYDFTQDVDALTASFLDAYGIDLSTACIHWWTFRRLMLNLPPETPFMQRVRYRTADIKKLGKEEKKLYKKMRALYAIKDSQKATTTVEEREAALRERIRQRTATEQESS